MSVLPSLPGSLSRTRVLLLLLAALIAMTIAGQTWWAVAQDRQQTLASEATNNLIATRLLEEHASQTFQDAAHTLDRVARAVQASPNADDPAAVRRLVALHDIGHSRHLKAVQYVSPQGYSWISSPDYPTHATQVAGRDHIQYLLRHTAQHNPVVGRPYASAYDSQWVIPVARNLFNAKGESIGVVSVDIRLAYFGALYLRVAKENTASVSLVSSDGYILARSPFEARYVDRYVADSRPIEHLRAGATEGTFSDTTFLDDEESAKLYTYRKLADFPVTVVYARELTRILTPWERRTYERILMACITVLLTGALIYFLRASILRLQGTQHSLQQSEAKFLGLFKYSPAPSVLARRSDGLIVEVNDAWLTKFGFQRHEVLGKTSHELNLWLTLQDREDFLKAFSLNQSVDGLEMQQRHRDGHAIKGLLFVRGFQSGSEELLICAMVDGTRQREIEQEIRTINQELELRVQARTENLEVANHDLNTALQTLQTMQSELVRSEKMAALGSLVAGVAHELNTPIGNCVTVGSTLQEQAQSLAHEFEGGSMRRSTMTAFIQGFVRGTEILMSSLRRADELIRSFKRVAVDQSSDQRRSFDLREMLQEVCFTLEPMYKNTRIQLSIDVQAGVTVDSFPGALGQLVTNFVSNAIQHGFEGRTEGQMQLTASAAGDMIALVFTDDGLGMSDDTRNRVFDPFFTTKLGQGGSGLGMNIVYNIVHEVLGGSIVVHSSLGAGTRIEVTFPLKAPLGNSSAPTA